MYEATEATAQSATATSTDAALPSEVTTSVESPTASQNSTAREEYQSGVMTSENRDSSPSSLQRLTEDEIANRILSDISEENSEASDLAIMEDGDKTPTAEDSSPNSQVLVNEQQVPPPKVIHTQLSNPVALKVEIPPLPPLKMPNRRTQPSSDSPGSAGLSPITHSPATPKEEPEPSSNPPDYAQPPADEQIELRAVIQSRSPTASPSIDLSPKAGEKSGSIPNTPTNMNNYSGSPTFAPFDTRPSGSQTETKPKAETVDKNDVDTLLAEVAQAKSDFHNRKKDLRGLNRRLDRAADEAITGPKLPALDLSAYRGADLSFLDSKQSASTATGLRGGESSLQTPILPLEEFDWDSIYQTGPETYLLQVRDSDLPSRIRDYRRQLFGDEPDYREQTILNILSSFISVRERRRYTDVLKEDQDVRENMNKQERDINGKPVPSFKRFKRVDLIPAVVQPSTSSGQSGHAPIFQCRLHDASFADDGSVTLQATILASPGPEVIWFRNDELVEDDDRTQKTFQDGEARLVINPVRVTDAGLYKVYASNEHGLAFCEARLKSGDLPERPSRPDVELASDTEVFLTWLPPQSAGYTDEIHAYRVEYRRAGDGQWSCPWMTISSGIMEEAAVVRHLEVQGIYQFRIVAKNDFGWGEPSLASRMIQTHPKGAHKLSIDLLKRDYMFCIINIPQGLSHTSPLGEIPEDVSCSASPSRDDSEEISITCQRRRPSKCKELNTNDDPKQRYQLESEIFMGRFCLIREAVDKTSEHAAHCVAKIILAAPDYKELAVKEYECLREVQHENVISLLDCYLREDFVLLFVEKLQDSLLHRFTIKDYYTEDNVAQVASQLLCALQWIHFNRILHLDIQPDNILFIGKRGWNIKLIDFGSAVKLSPDGDARPDPATLSLEFAAPELLQHGFAVPASDVWGVGLIMFILLSGYHPHNMNEEETEEQIIRNITQTRLDINYIYTNASEDCLTFLTWALKKHPSNRMTTEEGLQHRWLTKQTTTLRRRENIRFSANRLRGFAAKYLKKRINERTTNNQLLSVYGTQSS